MRSVCTASLSFFFVFLSTGLARPSRLIGEAETNVTLPSPLDFDEFISLRLNEITHRYGRAFIDNITARSSNGSSNDPANFDQLYINAYIPSRLVKIETWGSRTQGGRGEVEWPHTRFFAAPLTPTDAWEWARRRSTLREIFDALDTQGFRWRPDSFFMAWADLDHLPPMAPRTQVYWSPSGKDVPEWFFVGMRNRQTYFGHAGPSSMAESFSREGFGEE